ncbi:MAG TPA: TIGR00730 family Rossman fold protein [Spirochaetia bacterium]|nr:TIGR00730 family Rossman fold protein [Spirochaetia bacterium]
MNSLCVFCGSSIGISQAYANAASELASLLVARGIQVVYGGGRTGIMGVVAEKVIRGGGRVVGVMPRRLVEREIAHEGLTELYITESMQERKAKMSELSDGFLCLPGGFGTLEEVTEVLSWAQIGLHAKPCCFLNTDHYFDSLLSFFDEMVDAGFLAPQSRRLALTATEPAELLDLVAKANPTHVDRWSDS